MTDGKPTHLDIFSGIGGFAIAAQWAGFETVGFCEAEPRCRAFLENTWGKPVHPDIRQFDAKSYRGISLLTGGPPCQPASRAGKQGGAGDDRWLWPEALRVLEEAQPDCVVFENPPGILDVGIDGILSEMGRLGYEVQPFDIPACAVDSPQLRHRIWFVGFATGQRAERDRERGIVAGASSEVEGETWQRERRGDAAGDSGENSRLADTRRERSGQDEQGRRPDRRAVDRRDCADNVAISAEPRHQRSDAIRGLSDGRADGATRAESSRSGQINMADPAGIRSRAGLRESGTQFNRNGPTGNGWANSVWVPCADGKLRRAPDDSFGLVDGLHRSLLAALGNSIVPEVAFQILRVVRTLI